MKNIILIVTLLIFAGCSSDDTKDKKQKIKEVVQKKVKQEPKKVIEKKEVVSKKEPIVEVTKKEIQKVKEVKKVIVKEEPKEEVKKVTKASKSGKEIFQACTACHGAKADKPALGKSQIIKGWEVSRLKDALNGYKNGTYGGAMKALMIGQVGFLSDEEVQSVSEYISKL